MKSVKIILLLIVTIGLNIEISSDEHEWKSIFNGDDLTGWRANLHPESVSVEDGSIRVQSVKDRVHVFYIGENKKEFVKFKNFELKLKARGKENSNSGIFFHTDYEVRDKVNHLANGYEVQLNSTKKEKRKTGSLYAIVDFAESVVNETEWFDVYIKVNKKHILVKINGETAVDYTEPENPNRPPNRKGRLIKPDGGAIALQAHDPNSVFYFKDIYIRELH